MSGGNKRRRKKCHWNICHLGINVVQSITVELQGRRITQPFMKIQTNYSIN